MITALEAVRGSPLLASCAPAVVEDVVRRSREITLAPGELLFSEEDRAEQVWILLDGSVIVTKRTGDDEIVLDHLHPGAHLGEISLLTATRAQHRARGHDAARLLGIPGAVFRELIHTCDGAMATVVRTLAGRMRRMEHLLQQRERMAGLGAMAAGLAHELNNPAAAARRATAVLREQFDEVERTAERLAAHVWTPAEARMLERLKHATRAHGDTVDPVDAPGALERSDREEALGRWLESRGIGHGWAMAPVLVERGIRAEQLDGLTEGCEVDVVMDALAWTERMATFRQLLREVSHSTTRIHELVSAVRAYSYVDTTTLRVADVHEGLDQCVTILGHKLRDAKAVLVREYDRSLPPVEMYGTELTQVWTNLIDNAADAVAGGSAGGERTVRLRTMRDGDDAVVVEITDGGPGIAPELRGRIFDPFFTTKPAGRGTGLGLEIVKRIVLRHRGSIGVESQPGATRFTVRLPVRQPTTEAADHPQPSGAPTT